MMENKRQTGQASIEFIISFVVGFGFLIVFLSVSLNMVSGYLAHYATYTASRVYLTHETNQSSKSSTYSAAQKLARETFAKVPLSKFGIRDGELKFFNPNNSNGLIYRGAYFRYKKLFSAFGMLTGNAMIDHISESYLGREPTRQDCLERTCEAMGLGSDCSANSNDFDITVFDNGC